MGLKYGGDARARARATARFAFFGAGAGDDLVKLTSSST
jgi:hypothetical protein